MHNSVEYGNSIIEFQLKRSVRKTLGISILPNGEVEVTAPESASIEKIKEIVLKRSSWVLEQKRLTNLNPLPQPKKQFISGESFYYLGRHYRLRVFESNYDSLDILDDRLVLNSTFPEDIDLKRSTVLKWYLNRSSEILTTRFQEISSKLGQQGIQLAIKKLSKRWGEYHPSQRLIVLNAELVVAPTDCIDYVIVHELCHAIHPDHSAEFFIALENYLPNWRNLKARLEEHGNGFEAMI